MIAVIYRFRLKPGKEQEYQKNWHKLATYFINHRGAIGSCLHKTDDDLWVAYSRWPNQKTRAASWPKTESDLTTLPEEIKQVRRNMEKCIKRKYPETCLNIVDDFLLKH